MMVELLAAGLVGDLFSFEAKIADNKDGGPARGGEFIMALSPQLIAGDGWREHTEKFFVEMELQSQSSEIIYRTLALRYPIGGFPFDLNNISNSVNMFSLS